MPNTIGSRNSLRRVMTAQEDLKTSIMMRYQELFPYHSPGEEFAYDVINDLNHEHCDAEITRRLVRDLDIDPHVAAAFARAVLDDARRLHAHWTQWAPTALVGSSAARKRPSIAIDPTAPTPISARRSSAQRARQPQSLLLALPAEMRVAIYEAALRPHAPSSAPYPGYEEAVVLAPAEQPALTRACTQLRAEALPLFYARNVFALALHSAEDLRRTHAWLAAIGPANVAALRTVVLLGATLNGPPMRNRSNSVIVERVALDLMVCRGATSGTGEVRTWRRGSHRVDWPSTPTAAVKGVLAQLGGVVDGPGLARVIDGFARECTDMAQMKNGIVAEAAESEWSTAEWTSAE